ncbi:GtrA family protein [Nevskia soli]|uniref:GtrA family protein n=1 Tax=Nevskia soli TaxID=418856 RepID=UPI0004A73128|nr:GtrA family protein [Nevskia soli]
MIDRLRSFAESRFARFVLTGGIAALVNITSRYFLSEWMSFGRAVATAYLFGMACAWILARTLVFESSGRHWSSELLRFGLVNVVAAAQVWLISVGLAEWLFPRTGYRFHPDDTAHIIGVLMPVYTSYLGHRYFSFAKRSGT